MSVQLEINYNVGETEVATKKFLRVYTVFGTSSRSKWNEMENFLSELKEISRAIDSINLILMCIKACVVDCNLIIGFNLGFYIAKMSPKLSQSRRYSESVLRRILCRNCWIISHDVPLTYVRLQNEALVSFASRNASGITCFIAVIMCVRTVRLSWSLFLVFLLFLCRLKDTGPPTPCETFIVKQATERSTSDTSRPLCPVIYCFLIIFIKNGAPLYVI